MAAQEAMAESAKGGEEDDEDSSSDDVSMQGDAASVGSEDIPLAELQRRAMASAAGRGERSEAAV